MQVKLSQGYVECLQPQFKQLDSVLDLNIVVNCYDDNPTILLFLRNTRADKATANADGRTDGETISADGETDTGSTDTTKNSN